MLKGTIFSIVPSLAKLNLSIQTCSFPELWKCARIVPVPKKGDLSLPENYFPISILSLPSKLLERHVYQIISNHLLIHHQSLTGSGAFPQANQPPQPCYLFHMTVCKT